MAFIRRERDRPFLVYLAHKAVHPDVVQRNDGSVDPESDLGYVPAPRRDDAGGGREGRIMATLDSLGILDRTAIGFTSDNGFFEVSPR